MSVCRYCGKEIIWGRFDDGRTVPLDPVAPVYELHMGKASRTKTALVSHFATCTKIFKKPRPPKEPKQTKREFSESQRRLYTGTFFDD